MLIALLRKVANAVHASYLRYRLVEAELDANIIQAEMLTSPHRLIQTHVFIAGLKAELSELEARR